MRIRDDDIGGAFVKRTFQMGDVRLRQGDALTRDQVLSIRVVNRRSLIDKGFLHPYPRYELGGERIIVNRGFGRYDVVEGRKLTDIPVPKEEAEAIVAKGSVTEH